MNTKMIGAAALLALSGFSGTVSANLVQFNIETSTSALELSLNEEGQSVYNWITVPTHSFSEQWQFGALTELWSSGVVSNDNGGSVYTYALNGFAPVSALGSTALFASLMDYNVFALPLSGSDSIQTMVNFVDHSDPLMTDFSNNTINFGVSLNGSDYVEQEDGSFLHRWFSYSRQYVLHLTGVDSASEVFSYDPLMLFNTLQSANPYHVAFYEMGYGGSSTCSANGECVQNSYAGRQYVGHGTYQYLGVTEVPAPAGWLLFSMVGGLMLRRTIRC